MDSLLEPTLQLVKEAVKRFDADAHLVEDYLTELFHSYPLNNNLQQVLLKVVALNCLYSTQIPTYSLNIPNLEDVAQHIYSNATAIDSALLAGSSEIVDWISNLNLDGKPHRSYFSFASKYCAWHNSTQYPIYDTRVDRYLWHLQKKKRKFSQTFRSNSELWVYPRFKTLMDEFRAFYGLDSVTYKDIDKFLWMTGEPVETAAKADPLRG